MALGNGQESEMKIKWSLLDTAKRAWCPFFCCDSYPLWQKGGSTVLAAFNQLFVATFDVITSDSLFHFHRNISITLHGFFLDSFPLKDQPDFLTTRKTKTKTKTKTETKTKAVWSALCPHKIWYISHLLAQIKYLKSAFIPIFKLFPSRYESDLSNEVLCSLVAQRAAKLWRSKLEFWKRNDLIGPRYPLFQVELDL